MRIVLTVLTRVQFDELFSEHLSFAGFHLRVDSFLQHFTLGISEHTPTNPDVTSAVYRRLDPEDHRIGGGHGTGAVLYW